MPCYYPLHGYRSKTTNATGKRSIVFNVSAGFSDLPVTLPCGRCIGCKLERSRQWAIRCLHESSLYKNNSFITLTYADKHLPKNGSIIKKHHQDFMKRLRYQQAPKIIRFYHCGEYGEKNKRPHYHTLLFNHDFLDKIPYSETQGTPLFISENLTQLWGKGFCTIGEVTFDSAAYVARYIMKKITGNKAKEHYKSLDTETGEIHNIVPEYTTMSRRPGIGTGWYDKFKPDVYPDDFIIINGKKMRPPRFYDDLYKKGEPDNFEITKHERLERAKDQEDDNTYDRLVVREKVTKARLKLKSRSI